MAEQMQPECGNLLRTYLLKVKHVTANWKTLGVLLGLDKCCLDGIEKQYRNVVDDCMMEMLAAWLQTNPSNTEEQLEDALKKVYPACTVRSGKIYTCIHLIQLMYVHVCAHMCSLQGDIIYR